MAGETKLLGFSARKITLSRWGTRAEVEVGEDVVAKIAEVCRNGLPMKPQHDGVGPTAEFDEIDARVQLNMSVDSAKALLELLSNRRPKDREEHVEHILSVLECLDEINTDLET